MSSPAYIPSCSTRKCIVSLMLSWKPMRKCSSGLPPEPGTPSEELLEGDEPVIDDDFWCEEELLRGVGIRLYSQLSIISITPWTSLSSFSVNVDFYHFYMIEPHKYLSEGMHGTANVSDAWLPVQLSPFSQFFPFLFSVRMAGVVAQDQPSNYSSYLDVFSQWFGATMGPGTRFFT